MIVAGINATSNSSVYRFVGNHEDASDLAQDVFVRVSGAPTFKGQAALSTWLHRIGVNVCLNRNAQDAAIRRLDSVEPATARTADAAPDAGRTRRARRAAMPGCREAARDIDPAHYPRFAARGNRGRSRLLGAVKANFFHALTNLKKLLTES